METPLNIHQYRGDTVFNLTVETLSQGQLLLPLLLLL